MAEEVTGKSQLWLSCQTAFLMFMSNDCAALSLVRFCSHWTEVSEETCDGLMLWEYVTVQCLFLNKSLFHAPFSKAQEIPRKKPMNGIQGCGDKKECCEMLPSVCAMAVTVRNSLKLRLSSQDKTYQLSIVAELWGLFPARETVSS